MDKSNIRGIITEFVKDSEFKNIEIFFEDDDAIRLVVVSDTFKGMGLMARFGVLSEFFLDFQLNNLTEYHVIFNPLTFNEKLHGTSELADGPHDLKKSNDGYAASSTY
jgi:hypothetical protein